MGELQDRLDRIKAGFLEQAPEAAVAVMSRATEDLRASGILDRIPKVGDALPPFELTDTDGAVVRSDDLRADGPLVVTVYRGAW
jgi:2-polyprenyl-6-methoxyphenol hydroxylase-like FAD-dependent oxidoreductase